ncbi:MAG: glycosyltransferase [Elusimicrobiota bacterium]|jgi:glycosyltransferase involved in cell wall biosynthesis|nr:glycosyltransferase [Elusimicrobiota bacterium]
MNIVLVCNAVLPPALYGGTERVVWYLGKALAAMGHKVTFMCDGRTKSDFAAVIPCDGAKPFLPQLPKGTDIIHFHGDVPQDAADLPNYIKTNHGQYGGDNEREVYVSKNHALRFGSNSYVYNGMDWDDYGPVALDNQRRYFHFLGKAAWRVKNLKGAVSTVLAAGKREELAVLGGSRLNFKMGFRFTLSPRVKFYGMVGGREKLILLQQSKGLVFPVLWHEPFGIAVIESLYFGCPVLATPYGSLPELVTPDVGFLSDSRPQLSKACREIDAFSGRRCHEYARDLFSSKRMALEYLKKYEEVLNGRSLNPNPPQVKNVPHQKFLPWYDGAAALQ